MLILNSILNFIKKQKKINKVTYFLKNKNDSKVRDLDSKKIILVEYNNFYTFNILLYYLINYLTVNENFKIKCYYNFHVIKHDFRKNKFKSLVIKSIFKLSLGISKYYKFLGCNELIVPCPYPKKYLDKIEKSLSRIHNNSQLLSLKINGILIGDLIYDCYLTRFSKPTIDIQSESFKNFFKEFNLLFYFWFEYFTKNKINTIVGPHLVYSYGIPLRVAKKFKTEVIVAKIYSVKKLKQINETEAGHAIVKKKFFSNNKQKANRLWAKNQLNEELFNSNLKKLNTLKISSFSNIRSKKLIRKESKLKILILPHDFYDAPNVFGNHKFFSDYYEWLNYLIKISKSVDYKWYVKTHPNLIGILGRKQKSSREQIDQLFKNQKNFTILPGNYSHKQIIEEKIDCMITCHGSAAHEYSYCGIPTIACSNVSPYKNYNFCIFLKNKKDLQYKIKNLKKIIKKHKINKNEILDYFYMQFNYNATESWLIDFVESSKYVGGWEQRNSSLSIFEYWIKNFEKIDKKLIYKKLSNFFKSKDNFLNKSHYK